MQQKPLIKRIPVILDTDIGDDIDDTWALAFLLNCPELAPQLVVTATGDTIYRAKIVARLLERAGRTDIPIGIGIRQKSDGPRERQQAWVGGYNLEDFPGTVYPDGVTALVEKIMDAPEPVTLIAIGPLTNVAAALAREPRIAEKTDFVGMLGSIYRHHAGKEGAIAEWNVFQDISACQKVFAAPWRKMTITPLDTCGRVWLEGRRYQLLRDTDVPLAKAVMENYRLWCAADSAYDPESRSSLLYDTVAVYLAFSTAYLRMEAMPLRVRDDGFTVLDARGRKVDVAIDWKDLEGFKDFLTERLLGDMDLHHHSTPAQG